MENAPADQNFVRAKLACLNTDTVQGTNLVTVKINPANNGMMINTSDVAAFTMEPIDPRDENYRFCMTFEGSDGLVYPWVADADGKVLVEL